MENINNINEKNQPVLELKYHISQDEYVYYNQLYATESFKKKKKKAVFTGILEFFTGLVFLITIMQGDFESKELLTILSAVMIGLGIYSLSFYRFIFPASLKKAAIEQYNKNKYLTNEITLQFYNNRLEETAYEAQNSYKWSTIESFAKSERLYFITIANQRSIIIPKSGLGDDKYMLEEFFEMLSKKYGKPYKTWIG